MKISLQGCEPETFRLEMYRLFDLDSKLEALCTAEEEGEESRMMGSSSGFRADESLQGEGEGQFRGE